jgi:succinyldiaminopimelate transaminase
VGTPVDPTPAVVREALAAATDAPGYPMTAGSTELKTSIVSYLRRRWGVVVDPAGVLPVVGTKELVAWLPTLLGLGPGDQVVHPELAYPTYAVGAQLAGATAVAADATVAVGPSPVGLWWLNSPGNPTGRVLPVEHLAKVVAWARERGTVLVGDECYLELVWDGETASLLHPSVSGGRLDGLLVVHSLSKRSSMAGYRSGFVAGDPALVERLLQARRHAGMMVPDPIQAASVAAWGDDEHVEEQRERYRRRRTVLRRALTGAGFVVEHSEGGLYLWATDGEPCWDTVTRLAELGILVAPGDFYGPAGDRHIRVALTATDERVAAAAERLASAG